MTYIVIHKQVIEIITRYRRNVCFVTNLNVPIRLMNVLTSTIHIVCNDLIITVEVTFRLRSQHER